MKRTIVRSSHLLCVLLAAALAAGGCATTAPSGTAPGSSQTTAPGETVIAASAQTLAATGVAYYVLHTDGSATAFSVDGAAVATLRGSFDGSRGSFDLRAGGQASHLDFTMARGDDGSVAVEGTADGQALSIAVSKDGQVIRWQGPRADDQLRPLLQGMSNDFAAEATAHDIGHCILGLAIFALAVSAWNPILMVQGAVAATGACTAPR